MFLLLSFLLENEPHHIQEVSVCVCVCVLLLFIWLCWVIVVAFRGFSLVIVCGLVLFCKAQALGHGDFSSCGTWVQLLELLGCRAEAQ